MQLNKTKLNIAFLCALCGKVFNIRANWCSLAAQPSLFPDKPAFSRNFFLKSKANFPNPRPLLTRETERTYNNLHPQNHKKSKPNPNPIQTQFSKRKPTVSQKIKKMENEPNFARSRANTSICDSSTYNAFFLKNPKGNEPK